MQNKSIKIDIVSDVACPWCYVGKKRLEKAIKEWKGAPVEIEWHPFQLDPNISDTGLDRDTYFIHKFGNLEGPLEMTERLKSVGKEEGIAFEFGSQWLAVNTLPLHQLLYVAAKEGFQNSLKERFFKAYFEENLHLNKLNVICSLLSEYGWTAAKTKHIIADDAIAFKIKQEIAHYQKLGVNSVPFFIINNSLGISGARSKTTFLEAFDQVIQNQPLNKENRCDTETGLC